MWTWIYILLLTAGSFNQSALAQRFTAYDQVQKAEPKLVLAEKVPQSGTFWLAGGPDGKLLPPFPCPPQDLDVPIYDLGFGQYLVDDSSVDYESRKQGPSLASSESFGPPSPSEGGGESEPTSFNPPYQYTNGFWLEIYPVDDANGRRVSLNNIRTNLIYNIEQSTNLVDWSIYKTFVAEDTNFAFIIFDDQKMRFFRGVELDDRIQFPDWDDSIEQFLYFDVWTSIVGTYHLELWGDGDLIAQLDDDVPPDGFFGIIDGSYDPNDWPFAGFYAIDEWELRVTVTSSAQASGGTGPADARVKKKFRKPYQSRRGITVQQYGALEPISFLVQQEVDDYMYIYFLANWQATRQFSLGMTELNEYTTAAQVPRLMGAGDWLPFKTNVLGSMLSDLHYFGHGANTYLGTGGDFLQQLSPLGVSLIRPMRYVALDGCRTSKNTDLLKAFVGYGKKVSRNKMISKGWIQRFGWGWKDEKRVGYLLQGSLVDDHFYFITDYLSSLIVRSQTTGLFINTYEQAINFGQHPNGGGFGGVNKIRNYEGDSINYVGCYDCFFDE